MRQISLVGAVDEEVGDYFPEFLDMLEESPFLKVRGRFTFILVFGVLPLLERGQYGCAPQERTT